MDAPTSGAVGSIESNADSSATGPLPTHVKILSQPDTPQPNCPLFKAIPPEIRNKIFALALSHSIDRDHHDPDDDNTYPKYGDGCFLRRKSDTRLLRTCRAVYRETWALPFLLREHLFLLGPPSLYPYFYSEPQSPTGNWPYRRGSRLYETKNNFNSNITDHKQRVTKQWARFNPKHNNNRVFEIPCLQVFASPWRLDSGHLADLLSTPNLNPRKLVITIPMLHFDAAMEIQSNRDALIGRWICALRKSLPRSVQEITIRLETFECRKPQLDGVVKQMREKWFFRRSDGHGLYADITEEVDAATRTEVDLWNHRQCFMMSRQDHWLTAFGPILDCNLPAEYDFLDRLCTHPVEIKYYSAAVSFRPAKVIARRAGCRSALVEKWSKEKGFLQKLARDSKGDQFLLTVPPPTSRF